MKQYVTIDQWVDILRQAGRDKGGLVPLGVLSRLSGLRNFTLRKALLRLEKKRLLERVGPGLYLNKFGKTTLEELAMTLGKPCYVSFESALSRYSIISQQPLRLTCATTRRPGCKSTPLGEIIFRHIAPKRFWGYVESEGILRADPEKALLDWLYWSGKTEGRFPDLDEVNWDEINKEKIFLYLRKFPASISRILKNEEFFSPPQKSPGACPRKGSSPRDECAFGISAQEGASGRLSSKRVNPRGSTKL